MSYKVMCFLFNHHVWTNLTLFGDNLQKTSLTNSTFIVSKNVVNTLIY